MGIIRLNDLPDGSGNLTSDDIFLFMDNPSGGGITKKISLSEIASSIGSGGGGTATNVIGSGYINVSSASGTYTVTATGLQPSGNYSTVGHTHIASNITDFNSSVSGLLPVKDVLGSGNINVTSSSQVFTISSSGLVKSDISGIAGASGINNIVHMTQANYNALVSKDPNTVYFIV